MSAQGKVKYDRRSLREWIEGAATGKIAITDFQRSFVWQKQRSADYVKAILDDKPVGLYLTLETAEKPQFKPRAFNNFESIPLDGVEELVLDGQQRLTTLLQILHGNTGHRFFAEMKDLSAQELSVEDIVFYGKSTKTARDLDNPSIAYAENCIPMDVLIGDADEEGLKPLARWCMMVGEGIANAKKGRILEDEIRDFFDANFFNKDLWHCHLSPSTDARTAAEIFVDTNQSSVKISRFDVEVAVARGEYDEDLRATIREAFDNPANTILSHYFKEDPEDWVPEIGEWMLKVACLHAGKQPRESDYKAGLKYLLAKENEETTRNLAVIFSDLSWALEFAARLGGATKRTLPSWPPVHVLAALRRAYQAIRDPVRQNAARKLLEGYYWRCLFSDRYDMQANARLFGDFEVLKDALESIQENGTYSGRPPAFDDKDHPLYDADEFIRNAGWIGSVSRLGRALASVAMSSQPAPLDWITGETLDADRIRRLEKDGKLERHHIFPRHLLQDAQQDRDRINCALNGVLLDGGTNRRFYKHPPRQYVDKTLKAAGRDIGKNEMRDRIESHLVPYDEMVADGDSGVNQQYQKFLEKRADMLAREVVKLASLS